MKTNKVKSNYSEKSDVEVLDVYYNNAHWRTKQEIEAHLYKKYEPLCKAMSYKYRAMSTFEDNMQDCFLIMLKTLDGNQAQKISSHIDSFGGIFKGYLRGYFKSNYSQFMKDVHERAGTINEYTHSHLEKLPIAFIQKNWGIQSQETTIIDYLHRQDFEETLEEKEKRLFQMLADGMKKKDIVKELGEKHTANLTYWINKIQKKYIAYTTSIGYEITM